jgi:hypothetical protein
MTKNQSTAVKKRGAKQHDTNLQYTSINTDGVSNHFFIDRFNR